MERTHNGCAIEARETTWVTRDGLRLFVRVTEPEGPVRGTVVITHGMGEYTDRYRHVVTRFAAAGWRSVGYDLRGHGRSEGVRGRLRRYEEWLEDLDGLRMEFDGAGKTVLFGHSLGAQIVVNYLGWGARRAGEVSAAVLMSPWFRLAFRPPVVKLAMARLAALLRPDFTQELDRMDARLSRDQAFLESIRTPGLSHRRMSARMSALLFAAARRARGLAGEVRCPVLMVHGDADRITCCGATEEFYRRLGSPRKRLVICEGARHEPHNDIGREALLELVIEWMGQAAAQHEPD